MRILASIAALLAAIASPALAAPPGSGSQGLAAQSRAAAQANAAAVAALQSRIATAEANITQALTYTSNVKSADLVTTVTALNTQVSALQIATPPYTTVFTASGTFTPRPTTIYWTYDIIGGGGGGGASGGKFLADGTTACPVNNGVVQSCVPNGTRGGDGGASSITSTGPNAVSLTAPGGKGGNLGGNVQGGVGVGGSFAGITNTPAPDQQIPGVAGGPPPGGYFTYTAAYPGGGTGGGIAVPGRGTFAATGFGAGGAGGPDAGTGTAAGSGGSGAELTGKITSLSASYTITVGQAGSAGVASGAYANGSNGYSGGAGYAGKVIIIEFAR